MAVLSDILENLLAYQQQPVIDILLAVQDHKRILPQTVGLIGCSIEQFPICELRRLLKRNSGLTRTLNRMLAKQGVKENDFVNLKALLDILIESEIENRVNARTQKTLLDFAEEGEENGSH